MILIGRTSYPLLLAAIGSGLLLSCQTPKEFDQSGLPTKIVEQLDRISRENLAASDYRIYKHGSSKTYLIVLPEDFCGSGGCETFIFVEKSGKVRKIYDDLAREVTITPVYPDGFQFKIERSGAMCGKRSNSSECFWLIRSPIKM